MYWSFGQTTIITSTGLSREDHIGGGGTNPAVHQPNIQMIVGIAFTSTMDVVMLLITVAEATTQISVVISIRTTTLPLLHKGSGTVLDSR